MNVMNVTFNSRPGVSNYVMHLQGSGSTHGEDGAQNQLPHAGNRKHRNNGYSNFYFSAKHTKSVNKSKQSEDQKLKSSDTYHLVGTNQSKESLKRTNSLKKSGKLDE